MTNLGLYLQLKGNRASQFTNYDFHSLASFNGVSVGADASGIYQLDVGDTDNGAKITSLLELQKTDFGVANEKRVRRLFIGAVTSGGMEIAASYNDGPFLPVRLRSIDSVHRDFVGDGNRDGIGRYVTVRIRNLDGADFRLDSIECVLTFRYTANR